MAYNPTTWVDGETSLIASRMNKIEQELVKVDKSLKYIDSAPNDLNDANQFGIYHLNGTYTNAPSSTAIYGVLIVYQNKGTTWTPSESSSSGSSWIWQEIRKTNGDIYTRHATNLSSEWSDWEKKIKELKHSTISVSTSASGTGGLGLDPSSVIVVSAFTRTVVSDSNVNANNIIVLPYVNNTNSQWGVNCRDINMSAISNVTLNVEVYYIEI